MPTIFYAWQSDRHAKVCHYFIRDCANDAIDAIKEESDAEAQVYEAPAVSDEVKLDHDTQGVPGSPHIAETIKQKIDQSAAFIADLTCVRQYATADGRKKRAQNANVLIELGLALRLKGAERILLVMNTAYGSPANLPFDLRHYLKPITYRLKDSTDKLAVAAAKKELISKLKIAIKAILEHMAASVTTSEIASGNDYATIQTNSFYARFNAGEFRDLKLKPDLVTSLDKSRPPDSRQAFLLLSIIPLKTLKTPLNVAAIDQQKPSLMRPIDAQGGWSWAGYGTRVICYDRPPRDQRTGLERPTSVVELNDDGCIFAGKRMVIWPQRIDGKDVANLEIFERAMLFSMTGYIKLLRDLLVTGPLTVHVIIDGMADAYISSLDPHGYSGQIRPIRDRTTKTRPATLSGKIDGNSVSEVAEAMRPSLNLIWRDAGHFADPAFDDKGRLREPLP